MKHPGLNDNEEMNICRFPSWNYFDCLNLPVFCRILDSSQEWSDLCFYGERLYPSINSYLLFPPTIFLKALFISWEKGQKVK